MKTLLLAMGMFLSVGCTAQKKIDLDEVKFSEDMETFVKDVPEVHKGNLFATTNMFSYGVSKNSVYYFKDFLPNHVELLSYNGKLAGFSIKMKTFEDEQKVEGYLRQKYKLAFNGKETTDVTSWKYADDKIIVDFKSIGSIHRKTYSTLDYIGGFREIVRTAKLSIHLPVSEAFDIMRLLRKDMKATNEIAGVGGNILAEILLTYNPEKFANLNKNPLEVLKLLGKKFNGLSSFKGKDYNEYMLLLTKIKDRLGMRTFLEIDSFFNFVYWNLLED